mmetsp:Transcript_48571/g.145048  ORF Transcript_48571/g.145048 Transcript_48571/m.145048 type:complete len:120 (+) Transcript_48571:1778-2137(+)
MAVVATTGPMLVAGALVVEAGVVTAALDTVVPDDEPPIEPPLRETEAGEVLLAACVVVMVSVELWRLLLWWPSPLESGWMRSVLTRVPFMQWYLAREPLPRVMLHVYKPAWVPSLQGFL